LEQHGDWDAETVVYRCNNCGAKEIISKKDIAKECPYCGTTNIVQTDDLAGLRPDSVVPYKITKDEAAEKAAEWIRKRKFAPKWYRRSAEPKNINGLFLPAFTFDTNTQSNYNGVLIETYFVTVNINGKATMQARTRLIPIRGTLSKNFDDILVTASSVVPAHMFSKLGSFSTNNAKDYKKEFLFGFTASQYTKDGKMSWNEAKSRIDNAIRTEIIRRHGGGSVQSLYVNTNCFATTYKYVLLPIYVGHSAYKEKVYNFYVHGGNGKVAGQAPKSGWKIFFTVSGIILVAAVIALASWWFSR
jgi:DNA-directed RNA polymerase subunit RPC12/RpoP